MTPPPVLVAGTAGSSTTYLLLKSPAPLARLTAEVRSSFSSDNEITIAAASELTYLSACINEALRCYPPIPMGLTRRVPHGGTVIAGNFVPAKVSLMEQYSLHKLC